MVIWSKGVVTSAVDTMERDGLVRRSPVRGDSRLRRVIITSKGLDVIRASIERRRHVIQAVISCLDQEQTQEFRDTLRTLRKHLLKLLNEGL
jgi:DNA-binding MarR family transcriptional regulator